MADPNQFQFDLDPAARPDFAPLAEQWYPHIRPAALRASSSRIYDAVDGIRAIVIHATAGGSSSGAASVIFARKASFHWLVPDEEEPQHGQFVWATCHEGRAAWHVRNGASHPAVCGGQGRINHRSLGVEVVNRQKASDTFSPWQIEATAQIVRYAWAKYPNLRHVVSHARLDPRRRSDPGVLFPWDRLRSLVMQPNCEPMPALASPETLPPVETPLQPCCMPA